MSPSEHCTLNRGAFQLPILLSTLDRSNPLSVQSLPWESRLPCASLLVGTHLKPRPFQTTAPTLSVFRHHPPTHQYALHPLHVRLCAPGREHTFPRNISIRRRTRALLPPVRPAVQVRVLPAPRSPDGMVLSRSTVAPRDWRRVGLEVPFPGYGAGRYISDLLEPGDAEHTLYGKHFDAGHPTTRDILEEIQAKVQRQCRLGGQCSPCARLSLSPPPCLLSVFIKAGCVL